jgi:uncharacterized membrane protein (UPF0136 family)
MRTRAPFVSRVAVVVAGTLLYPQGMLELVKYYYFIFGALTIIGGVIGFKKAGSKASLIAGSISGVLILAAAVLILQGHAQNGVILGLVVSSLLEIRFFPAFMKTKKVMPAGMMTGLSMIGTLLSVLALVFNR